MTKDTENPSWGLRLRSLRGLKRLTRKDLAQRLTDISMDTLNRIERGEVRQPRGNKQAQIADALGVSLGYLLSGKPHHPSDPDTDILLGSLGAPGFQEQDLDFNASWAAAQSERDALKTKALSIAQSVTADINSQVFNQTLSNEQCNMIFGIVYNTFLELKRTDNNT